MRVGVVIPSFNESETIGEVIESIGKYAIDEILVIDDGSTDDTSKVAKSKGAEVITHSKNLGKGKSIKEGIEYLYDRNIDYIIFMDGDGQHNPDELPYFINNADKNVVVGNRMQNHKNMPFIRWITNKIMSLVIFMLCGQYVPDSQCGYRLVNKKILKNITLKCWKYEIESEMILKISEKNIKIHSVPISTIYKSEVSQINPLKDTFRFLGLVKRFLSRKMK